MYKGPLEIFHASRGFIFRGNVESEERQTKLFIVKHFTFTGTALSRCRFHGDRQPDSFLPAGFSVACTSIWCAWRRHSVHKYIPERLSLLCYMKGCPPSSNSMICLQLRDAGKFQRALGSVLRMLSLKGTHVAWTVASLPSWLWSFKKVGVGGNQGWD